VKFENACRRAMDEGVTVHFEEYYPPLDTWFESTVYPSAEGVTVYAQDISKRKRVEEALRESERFVRKIIELSPNVLDIFDLETEQHSFRTSDTLDLFGYTPAEIAQMEDHYAVLVHPDDILVSKTIFSD